MVETTESSILSFSSFFYDGRLRPAYYLIFISSISLCILTIFVPYCEKKRLENSSYYMENSSNFEENSSEINFDKNFDKNMWTITDSDSDSDDGDVLFVSRDGDDEKSVM